MLQLIWSLARNANCGDSMHVNKEVLLK
ncbi:hypothetical protein F383_15716 [Gossypium arboreum]|uniref:Uncharacterized protein n=1 Tax=Gossypium arboreum TaxID=29729 RepID=A0A0B0PUS9_GOSAR|nr:hypothetical protein F383_15716 [Gossypium arboreum]